MDTPSKTRGIVTWVITGAPSAMLLMSAFMKLTLNAAAVASGLRNPPLLAGLRGD